MPILGYQNSTLSNSEKLKHSKWSIINECLKEIMTNTIMVYYAAINDIAETHSLMCTDIHIINWQKQVTKQYNLHTVEDNMWYTCLKSTHQNV